MYILSQIIKEQEAFWSHMRCQIYSALPFTSFEVIWIQGSWLTGAHNGILGGHDLLMPVCPTQRNSTQSQRKKTETVLSASLFHGSASLSEPTSVCVCVTLYLHLCVWLYLHPCVWLCLAVPTSVCVIVCVCVCVCVCDFVSGLRQERGQLTRFLPQ